LRRPHVGQIQKPPGLRTSRSPIYLTYTVFTFTNSRIPNDDSSRP
jgi:hypothetical protein